MPSSQDLPVSHLAIMRALGLIIQNQLAIMQALPHQTVATTPGHDELHARVKITEAWIKENVKDDP